jgi:hypothetical protein
MGGADDVPAWTDMDERTLQRLRKIPRRGLSAVERYAAQHTIATDEFLAAVVRSENPGEQLREAGYAALADALGY